MINPPLINSRIGIVLFGSFRPSANPIIDNATAPTPKILPRIASFSGRKPCPPPPSFQIVMQPLHLYRKLIAIQEKLIKE